MIKNARRYQKALNLAINCKDKRRKNDRFKEWNNWISYW